MLQAMSTAATGMQAQETQIQVISNNLANASTPGFKVSRAHFQDLLYVNERQAGTQSSQTSFVPTGSSIGLGSKTASVDQVFTEGELDNTGNPLDVAIQGNGFFQVSMPDGSIAYTRDGSFRLDQNGRLVTLDGYARDARHQRAAGRAQPDHRSRRHRFGAGWKSDAADPGRAASDHQLSQSVRPTTDWDRISTRRPKPRDRRKPESADRTASARWRRASLRCPTKARCRNWSDSSRRSARTRPVPRPFRSPIRCRVPPMDSSSSRT